MKIPLWIKKYIIVPILKLFNCTRLSIMATHLKETDSAEFRLDAFRKKEL